MIKVSVIIPTFNEAKNIGRLLKSVRDQSVKSEVIVVDDGSRDETVAIAKKYTRLVFARQHAERSVQRNFGVARATGQYVLILDADMELTEGVIESCLAEINGHGALIIPEKTVGKGFVSSVRSFEREMYMGDASIEVARFFPKLTFNEFRGYDVHLTGTEDYDLPYRISKKYSIGWAKKYILHHEENLSLVRHLKKKFYYASKSVAYAKKHPQLIMTQGNMLFRSAYFRHWKKFIKKPLVALAFVLVKSLEMIAALAGFAKGVFSQMVRSGRNKSIA